MVGRWGYVVKEGKPVVYSWGVDGDDDGGRLPKVSGGDQSYYVVGPPRMEVGEEYEGDWVIWSLVAPVEKNGEEGNREGHKERREEREPRIRANER